MPRIFVFAFALLTLCAASALAEDKLPNLLGDWNITFSEFHVKTQGYLNKGTTGVMNISKQRGRIIQGTIKWVVNGTPHSGSSRFSGVIAKDNKTAYIAAHNGSIRILNIEGPNTLSMYVLHPGGDKPASGYVEFERMK